MGGGRAFFLPATAKVTWTLSTRMGPPLLTRDTLAAVRKHLQAGEQVVQVIGGGGEVRQFGTTLEGDGKAAQGPGPRLACARPGPGSGPA